ncbi:MAG: class I SAM-dependent methyltransferase [Rhodothermales bacterium]
MNIQLDDYLEAYSDDFEFAFDNAIILNWYPTRIIAETPSTSRVLELGVGHGFTCHRFAEHFEHYEVIEGSGAVIESFRSKYSESNAILHEGFFEDFEPSGKFDVIVMGFVLEHVEEPEFILRRYRNYLSENGRVVVAVPNAESLHRRFGHESGLLPDIMEMGAGDKALGHQRLFTRDTLQALMVRCGYTVTASEGIFLKPFTTGQLKSLDLSNDVLNGMCVVGRDYPELSAALLFEATAS